MFFTSVAGLPAKITIEDSKTGSSSSEADDNLGLAKGVTDGYDAVLKSETADAWFFECKKQKSNKDKDAPKKMDISQVPDAKVTDKRVQE